MEDEMNTPFRNKIIFGLGIIILLISCENPLRVGLGNVVDVDPPQFNMNPHGSYLRNLETFTGAARDDIAIASIKVRISVIRDNEELVYEWRDVDSYDSDTKIWSLTIDTAEKDEEGLELYPDGPLSLQFQIQDTSNRAAVETGKYTFTVKNSPPLIEMSIPSLNGTRKGSEYAPTGETGFNDPYLYKYGLKYQNDANTVPSSGTLVGSITDLQGIAPGYPRIKFWPAEWGETPPGDTKNLEHDDDGIPGTPPAVYGGWDEVELNETPEALAAGPKFLQFTFPLLKWRKNGDTVYKSEDPLDPVEYYFQFKVNDVDPETEETVYPIFEEGNPEYPNRALKIKLITPKSTPEVRLHDAGKPRPNQWITTDPEYKNDGFVLRIEGQDQDGIRAAKIELSKEGDLSPYPPIYFNTEGSNASGYPEDPGLVINGETKRFDYTVDKASSVELNPRLYEGNMVGGPGVYRYRITVYAKSGNIRIISYRVYVDGEAPSMDLGNILGAISGDSQDAVDSFKVNGTIVIPVNIYDSMGLMPGVVNGKSVQEKKWFLSQTNYDLEAYFDGSLSGTDRTALETFFDGTPNPAANPPQGDYFTDPRPASPAADVYYSPFIASGGSLRLDTTAYYNTPGQALGTGDQVWYFYIYALDQAYNRQIRKLTFYVNQEYDKPLIRDAVIVPLSGFDGITAENRSNIFTANSKFSLTLSDDEGLDLSAVEIKIAGITSYDPVLAEGEGTVSGAAALFGGASYNGTRTRSGSLTQRALAEALYGTGPGAPETLRDGQYTITITAKDYSPNKNYPVGHTPNPVDAGDPTHPATGTVVFPIVKDTRDPRIVLDAATAAALKIPVPGPAFRLTGFVRDENKIDFGTLPATPGTGFKYLLGAGDASSAASLFITPLNGGLPNTSGLYEYQFDTGDITVGTETGNRNIYLFAKDIYGAGYYRYDVVLKVDGEPPAVNLSGFNRTVTKTGDPKKYINQTVSFSVTANDPSGIKTVKWLFEPSGSVSVGDPGALPFADPGAFDFSGKQGQTYTDTLDTTALDSDGVTPLYPAGLYDLIVLAEDNAGNKKGFILDSYQVDQDTDKPSIKPDRFNAPSISPNGTVAQVYSLSETESALRISGTVTDDDGFDPAREDQSVRVEYSPDGGANWYGLSTTSPGNETWAAGTAATFDLSFEAYIPNDDSYLSGSLMGLSGLSSQGTKKFRITVYDSPEMKTSPADAVSSTVFEYDFIVDTRPPEIEFNAATMPNEAFSNEYGDIHIKGTVKEDNLRIKNDGTGDYHISFSLISDGVSWSAAVLTENPVTGGDGIKVHDWETVLPAAIVEQLDGYNTVKITVEDQSNQISTVDWGLTIDAEGPEINFDNIRKEAVTPESDRIMILTTPQIVIKGSFTDGVTLYESYHDTARPERAYFSYRIDYPLEDDDNWIDFTDASWGVKFRNTGVTVNWELPVSDAAIASGGHPGTGAGCQTEHNLPDGLHWVDIKYTDLVGNLSENDGVHDGEGGRGEFYRAYFKIDRSAPALTLPAAPAIPWGAISGGDEAKAFSFAGTTYDALFTEISARIGISENGSAPFPVNPGDSIKYKALDDSDLGEAKYETVPVTTVPYIAGEQRQAKWEISVSKKTLADLKRVVDGVETTEHGEYSLFVWANDENGGRTMGEYKFKKDLKAPNLVSPVFTGSPFKLVGQNPSISGSAYDAFKIKTLTGTIEHYKYTRVSGAPDTWTGAWTAIGAETDKPLAGAEPNKETVPWTKNLSSLADGRYRIRIKARDYTSTGNSSYQPSETGWQELYIDRTPPVLKLNAYDRVYKDPDNHLLTFTGTVTDFYTGLAGTDPIEYGNRLHSVRAKLVKKGQSFEGRDPALYTGNNFAVWEVPADNFALLHSWSLALSTTEMTEGEYTLHVLALDDAGNAAYDDSRKIVYDITPPTWEIISPVTTAGELEGGETFDLHPVLGGGTEQKAWGRSADDNGVNKIEYYFGVAEDPEDITESQWTSGLVYQTGYGSDPQSSAYDAYRLVRSNGAYYNWELTFPRLNNFLDATFLGSIANAPTDKKDYVGEDPVDSKYVEGQHGVWELPVHFRVTDAAGNTAYYEQKIWINSKANDPGVTITRPGNGSRLGGEITLGGSARDDVWVNKVVFRVVDSTGAPKDLSSLGFYPDSATDDLFTNSNGKGWFQAADNNNGDRGSPFAWSRTLNSGGELNPGTGETEKTWQIEALAWDAVSSAYPARNTPDHIADSADLENAKAKITITFIKDAPRIAITKIEHAADNDDGYEDDMTFAGDFTVHASVFVATGAGINTLSYQGTGSTSPVILYQNGQKTTDSALASQVDGGTPHTTGADAGFTEYKLNIPVPPSALAALAGAGTAEETFGGTMAYALSLNVTDNIPYRAQENLRFNIDNRYPAGTFTGNTNVISSAYSISGTALDLDSATGIGEVDRVVLYFSRGGSFISLKEAQGDSFAFVPLTGGLNVKDMADGGKLGGITYPDTDPAKNSAITIDRNETSDLASSGGDGDGYVEGFVDEAGGKRWSVHFNTLQLKGGPVTLHYVIFDKQGHAVHYTRDLMVSNLKPLITGVTLSAKGADGSILPGTRISSNYKTTNFTVKNNYLAFKVDTSLGNREMNYRITYLDASAPEISSTDLVAGKLYRIKTQGDTDWIAAGAAAHVPGLTLFIATGPVPGTGTVWDFSGSPSITKTVSNSSGGNLSEDIGAFSDFSGMADTTTDNGALFAIKVWDKVNEVDTGEAYQLYNLEVVGLTIANTDTTAPELSLYNLNPNGIRTLGGNETATISAAARPPAVGANQSRGGLYNNINDGGTESAPVWSGHIEPAKTTGISGLSNMTAFDRDTVSGTVILRGKAADSHRVKEITLRFGSIGDFTILKADDNGPLLPGSGEEGKAFYVEEYTRDGHTVEWAYVWNTEEKPALASEKAADELETGTYYQIKTPGDTDWTDVGAANSGAGTIFIATGPGTGTGEAYELEADPLTTVITATAKDGQDTPSLTASRSVDVRPFIQKLERTRTGAAQNRSAQGWYSASRNETLRIKGFNLTKNPPSAAKVKVCIGGGTDIDAATQSLHEVTVDIGSAAGGKIILKSDTDVEAVNNIHSAGKTAVRPWNRENSTAPGSELWDDGRYIHVWDSASGTFPDSGNAKEISMTARQNGDNTELHGGWADRGDQSIYHAQAGAAPTRQYYASDNSYDTDVHYSSSKGIMVSFVLYNGYNGAAGSEAAAGGFLITGNNISVKDIVYDDKTPSRLKMMDNAHNISDTFTRTDRFQRPRMVSNGNAVYTSYYDKYTHALRYSFTTNVDTGGWDNVTRGVIEGSGSTTYVEDPASDVGSWSAIDLMKYNGSLRPVAAYYDATRDTLRMAIYNGSSWVKGDVLAATDPYHDGSGSYVSIRVKTDVTVDEKVYSAVHLAFFNTSETAVVYATKLILQNTTHTDGDSFDFTSALVDSGVSNGMWADISLDTGGNPWITYLDMSRPGRTDAMRLAYKNSRFTKEALDYNGKTITGWEALTVASGDYSVLSDERLSIENRLGSADGWDAALGYKSGDLFRINYYTKMDETNLGTLLK
jgi:hypothetical protein